MTTVLGDRKADDFLKVFWTSRYGRVQRGTLFNKIRAKYSTKASVIKLSEELYETVELYAALDSYDSDVWAEHSDQAREHVKTLTLLAAAQVRPILISALFKLSPSYIERLLYWLVTLIVRYQTVGGGRTGRLEQLCASVAPKVFSGEMKTAQKIWDNLKSIVPKDDEFRNDFKAYSEATAAKARYILAQIEIVKWQKVNPEKDLEKTPCSDTSILNLEHILPKNPSNEWGSIISADKTIVQECLNSIGNLCLLSAKVNRQLGSLSFQTKSSETYKKSEIITTRDLSENYSNWDRKSIESRTSDLAELAIEAWPIVN